MLTFKGMVIRAGYKNLAQFARQNKFEYDTVKGWSSGRRKPDFQATLRLLIIFGQEDLLKWGIGWKTDADHVAESSQPINHTGTNV